MKLHNIICLHVRSSFIVILLAKWCEQYRAEYLCSIGEVPFLEEATYSVRHCSETVRCPIDYYCNINRICCGKPGKCPLDRKPVTDTEGRIKICSLGNQSSCPNRSICQHSSTVSQHMCCQHEGYSCTRGMEPYPDFQSPILCDPLSSRNKCPSSAQCILSNSSGEYICCMPPRFHRLKNHCLKGWLQIETLPEFCDPSSSDTCSPNSKCLQSVVNPKMHVCCSRSDLTYRTRQSAMCSGNAVVELHEDGRKRTCAINNPICSLGYDCIQAINDPSQYICCTNLQFNSPTESTMLLKCPANGELLIENGKPKYCSPTYQSSCPLRYACRNALIDGNTFICCSTSAAEPCPSNFIAVLDDVGMQLRCSPNDPLSCSGGALCIQSRFTRSTFICCRAEQSAVTCPNNLKPFLLANGDVEICPGPRASCSNSEFACTLSKTSSSWICCGPERSMALCADGRETYYQIRGETYKCERNVYPTGCPVNYECAVSTIVGVSVCCKIAVTLSTVTYVPPTSTPQQIGCPVGWNPYRNEIDGKFYFCRNVGDNNCPIGFSCTRSVQEGIFICCRFAGKLDCPPYSHALLVNNHPRLCTVFQVNFCPRGYSCQRSTVGNINICCSGMSINEQSFSAMPRCLSSNELPAMELEEMISCMEFGEINGCPPTFTCTPSTIVGINVCCRSSSAYNSTKINSEDFVCGIKSIPFKRNGQPVQCSSNNSICPKTFHCQSSTANSKMYCCGTHVCPFGLIPLLFEQCKPGHGCSKSFRCMPFRNAKGFTPVNFALISNQLETNELKQAHEIRAGTSP